MVRRKDPFWMYVEDLKNGRFSCKFCQRSFAGSISRIQSHLSGFKGRNIQICPLVPEAVKLRAQQAIDAIDTPLKRAKYVTTSNTVLQDEHISGSSSSHMPNLCKGHDKSILHKQLATFLSSEGISFDAVQSPLFKAFVNGIAEYGPGYQVPSYIGFEHYTEIVLGEVDKYVEKIKDYSVITGCTLMYSKSSRQKSFVDVYVYTPIGVACIDVFSLDRFNNVLSFMGEIHPKNVVQLIINDGEGDFEDEVSSICREYPWIYRTRCATRGIELLLRKIYLVPFVYNTIQVARGIGRYIYENKVNVPYLRKKVNGRFIGEQRREDAIASSFFVLTSLLEVENELQDLREPLELQVPIEMVSSTLTEKFHRRARFTVYVIRCKEFWSRAKIVAQVMRPIFQALCLFRFEGPTSGYLYEMMESVKDALEQCHDSYHILYDVIRNILDEVRSNIIHPIHVAAAFLNPMYMCSVKFKDNDEMKNSVKHIRDHLVAAEEKEAFMKQVQLYRMKDSNVFTAEAMIKLETSHPLIWWEHCGNHISVLQKYAIRILSQPCGFSLCKPYKPLHEDLFDQHKFRLNAILMERYESKKTQIIEPIILDKLKVSDEVNYQLLFKNEWEDDLEEEFDDDSDEQIVDHEYSCIESEISENNVYLVDWSHRYADDIIKDPTGSWLDGWPMMGIESSK